MGRSSVFETASNLCRFSTNRLPRFRFVEDLDSIVDFFNYFDCLLQIFVPVEFVLEQFSEGQHCVSHAKGV